MATSIPNLVKISQIADELWTFSFFSKWRPPPSWILLDFILDHPQSLTDDLKLCLKFYVDPTYTLKDIVISIFENLA